MKPKILVILTIIFAIGLPFIFTNSCKHDPIGISQLDTVCFESQVRPIIQTSCGMSGCHNGGEEFRLDSYSDIMSIVQPGSARKSKLYKVITEVNGENFMPPNRPLSADQRTTIMVWIEQGALNTKCSPLTPPTQNMDTICFTQNIAPLFQSSCGKVNCHDAITHKGDYVLTDYYKIMQNTEGIRPFNPSLSKIYQLTSASAGEDIMPPAPNTPLTIDQREILRKWIAQGALNSNCPWTTCDTTGTIKYSTHIQPFIQNNCLGCHNPSNSSGGIMLNTYALAKQYSETSRNGTPIFIGAIKHLSGFRPMPPSGILSNCQIRTIELWISQGFIEN